MSFDPKLEEAAKRINAIVVEFDIAAQISLVSPTHSQYMWNLAPTWSACKTEGQGLRIKATEKDYGSVEKRNEAMSRTMHMILQIRDVANLVSSTMESITDGIVKQTGMKINHVPFNKEEPK